MSVRRKLYRSSDAVLFGVCGGMAEYVDLNPWGVRLIWVLLTLFGGPLTLLVYVILALVLEKRPVLPPVPESPAGPAAGPPPVPGLDTTSHSDTLRLLTQRFQRLEQRLQRMESVVTRPSFGMEKEWRDL